MSIIDYMFSTDDDWANPTIYVLKDKEGKYLHLSKYHYDSFTDQTVQKKYNATFFKRNVAEHEAKEHECEIEKIHWWDLLRKEVQNAVCSESDDE